MMRFRFGKESTERRSLADIEAEAAAEIEQRVALGKPPPEDFAPIENRLAELDAAAALARPTTEPLSAATSTNGHGKAAKRTTVGVKSQAAQAPAPAPVEPAPPAVKLNLRKSAARKPATGGRKPATATKPPGRRPATVPKPAGRQPARKSPA